MVESTAILVQITYCFSIDLYDCFAVFNWQSLLGDIFYHAKKCIYLVFRIYSTNFLRIVE